MSRRAALLVCAAFALGGCMPKVPRIDMSGVVLPKFEIFRYGAADPSVPTVPYALTPQNVVDVKTAFSAAFTDGRTLEFGPIAARRRNGGGLAICGLVSVRRPDGRETGMKLFDGNGELDPFGVLRFAPGRLADANAKPLDIYSSCRDLGVL